MVEEHEMEEQDVKEDFSQSVRTASSGQADKR